MIRMTVKELIAQLKDLDGDLKVLTAADEEWNGFNDYIDVCPDHYFYQKDRYSEIKVWHEDDQDEISKEKIDNAIPCVVIG